MRYSRKEERYNTISHALGVAFGLIGGWLLIYKSIEAKNGWAIAGYIIFVVFMTLMYLSSSFYHYEKDYRLKPIRRKYDHAAIYAQIAGSYTPFTLVVLRQHGAWGWTLFGVIWAAAFLGISLSFMDLRKGSKLETICYVAMGWVVVIAFKPLIDTLNATNSINVLWWLIGGGLFYTVGAVLYQFKKIPYMHAIWHLFVLGGSVCHFIAIWNIKI